MARIDIVSRDITKLVKAKGFAGIQIQDILTNKYGDDVSVKIDLSQKNLNTAIKNLAQAEDNLSDALQRMGFYSNSILDQLIDILKTDDAINLINNDGFFDDLGFSSNIRYYATNYVLAYADAYEQQINNISLLDDIGQVIRGDTSLFTIGLGAKASIREAVLDINEMHTFMSQKNRFELVRSGESSYSFGLKSGITKVELAESLIIAKGIKDENGNFLIGNNALQYFNSNDSTRQLIWKELQKSDITSATNKDILINSSRKYEILNMGTIWDSVYQNTGTIEEKRNLIQQIINSEFSQGFYLENTFFGARGDTLISRRLNDTGEITNMSLSQKYFTSGHRFNIADSASISRALEYWKNPENIDELTTQEIEKIFKDEKEASEFLSYDSTDSSIIDSMIEDSSGGMEYDSFNGYQFSEDVTWDA